MSTTNENILKDQITEAMQEQYKNHTTERLLTQIKTYEATAEWQISKANRNWAQAVNGGEGYHFHEAKKFYDAAAMNNAKAEALKEMVQMRNQTTKTHAFTGDTKAPVRFSNVGVCAATTAVVSGTVNAIQSALNGDPAEDVAASAVTGATTGGISSASSYLAGSVVAKEATTALAKTAVGAGTLSTVIPCAAGVGAAIVAGEVTVRVAKPFVEEVVDSFHYGDPLFGIGYGLERAGDEIVDVVEETVEAFKGAVDTIVSGIQDFFWFFC